MNQLTAHVPDLPLRRLLPLPCGGEADEVLLDETELAGGDEKRQLLEIGYGQAHALFGRRIAGVGKNLVLANHRFAVEQGQRPFDERRQRLHFPCGGRIDRRPCVQIARLGHVYAQVGQVLVNGAVRGDQHALIVVPTAKHLKILVPGLHQRAGAQAFGQRHVQIAPADQRKAEALAPAQLRGALRGIGLSAGEGGQHGGSHVRVLRIQLLFDGFENVRHFGDAHGLEQIVVHANLYSALRVFKFAIAADDHNVDIGLQSAGGA